VNQPRLLVVSHPAVLATNQVVYADLADLGWHVDLVVPHRWRHEYAPEPFPPEVLPRLAGRVHPRRIIGVGSIQRHAYVRPPLLALGPFRPDVLLCEQEHFSVPAWQWGSAARMRRVPYGVQAAENLDRPLPAPARLLRRSTLGHAAFVMARSPAAADLARRWSPHALSAVIPHTVPPYGSLPPRHDTTFTVGFAGRLVPEKGIGDLAAAVRLLGPPVRLLVAGDGPSCSELDGTPGLSLLGPQPSALMGAFFAELDVLVLPSRTMPTWAEQFGRVLVEALACGVPIIGSSSGEIPWVVDSTGGGQTFPEGDVAALAAVLADVRADPAAWKARAEVGKADVSRRFTNEGAAAALDDLLREVLS
jgi:glycosyltransferase involved in cell wall biosynthesis